MKVPNFAAAALALSIIAAVSVQRTADAQSAAVAPVSPAPATTPAPPADCSPVGNLHFVCGVSGVEDFLPVDGGRWLVGSSLRQLHAPAPAQGAAGLYLIDTAAKSARPVALSMASQRDPRYADCAAPDLKRLNTHGMDIAPGPGKSTTVYVINHEGRESVEVFHLHPAGNSAEWIGCVVLPPAAIGNSLSVLPNGGFVVSKFLDANDKTPFEHARAGQITGTVYWWTPGKGFSEVPGTRLSGNNGLLVSSDQKWLYVNAWGSLQIYRVPLSGQGKSSVLKVDFRPDNLRWAPDGKIFVTGQFVTPEHPDGPHGWTTLRLDPETMTLAPVVKEPGYAQFDDASNAVQVGGTLWFGTFNGDRVAYIPAP